MKSTLRFASLLIVVALGLLSCSPMKLASSGDHYKYDYEINKPTASKPLTYKDSLINVDFTMTEKEIDFVIKNKSPEVLKIIWDDASLVIYGKSRKVMHKGVKYIDRNSSMPPSALPPNSSLDDLVVPTENITYRSGTYTTYSSSAGGWETSDLFVFHDHKDPQLKDGIQRVKGMDFSLYLPIRNTSGKEVGYVFEFKVSDVTCLTCKAAVK